MKTYHIDRDGDLIDSETGMLADNSHDEVIPASVAQALYDALLEMLEAQHATEHGFDMRQRARKALSLADGEE